MTTESQIRSDFKDNGGIPALVADLLALSVTVAGVYRTQDPADLIDPDCDSPFIDCRLRYHDGSFSFITGDSQYDQDHRGHWGSSCVGLDLTTEEATSIALDLLDQILGAHKIQCILLRRRVIRCRRRPRRDDLNLKQGQSNG